MEKISIIDVHPGQLANYGVCGYKNIGKQKELQNKIDWYEENYGDGLRIKLLLTENAGSQGMIEYVPGEFAWRPIEAKDYMFVNCLYVGFKKEYKGQGFASQLIDECAKEARKLGLMGVAVVTRKGSFMADKAVFLKTGFEVVGKEKPDFELLALKFSPQSPNPNFKANLEERLAPYQNGLHILRSDQCPYSLKNVVAMKGIAWDEFEMLANIVNIKLAKEAQNCPSPFGTFCIVLNGKVVSYHPISGTRFRNILQKVTSKS
jgi:L-amino acid N-acyltransferase YncA